MGLFEWTPLALHMDLHGISICASECSFCMERPSVVRDLRGVVLWPFKIYDPWACSIFESPQKNRCFLVMSMFHRKKIRKDQSTQSLGCSKLHQGLQGQSYFLLASIHPKHPMFAELMSNFWAHVQTQTYRIIYIDLLRFIWYSLRVYPARLRRLSQFRPFKLPIVYPHSTSIFHLVVHLPSYQHPPDPHHEISHQIPPVFVAQRPAKASHSACNGYCAGHTVSGWLAKFRAQHLVFRTTLGGPCSVVLMVWYQL